MQLIKANGDRIWGRIIGNPIYIDNKIVKLVGYIMNVSDRKHAEIQLVESEEKYRTLIEISTDGVFVNQENKIVYVNSAALKLFGVSNENEVLGEPVLSFFHSDYHDLIYERIEKMIQTNESSSPIEERIIRKDGSVLDVEVSATPFMFKQKFAIQVIIRDITERKNLQKEILNAVINSEEKERDRIARELHDGVGPLLSSAKMVLQTHISSSQNVDPNELLSKKTLSLIDDAITSISEISHNISPHVLTHYGLTKAIETFINKISRTSDLKIEFNSTIIERIDQVSEVSLYRICLELINNCLKHANAVDILVLLKTNQNKVFLDFFHNGEGFDWNTEMHQNSGMGLLNINNRIQSLNGKLKWENLQKKGMKVFIEIPYGL